jgi:hypothetical protein
MDWIDLLPQETLSKDGMYFIEDIDHGEYYSLYKLLRGEAKGKVYRFPLEEHDPDLPSDVDCHVLSSFVSLDRRLQAHTASGRLLEHEAADFFEAFANDLLLLLVTERGTLRKISYDDRIEQALIKRVEQLGAQIERLARDAVRLPNHIADTTRFAYLDDMPLFAGVDMVRAAKGKADRMELLEALSTTSHEILARNMSGTEWAIFLLIAKLFEEHGAPREISIEVNDFFKRLGYFAHNTGRTKDRIRDIILGWQDRRFRVATKDTALRGHGLSFSSDILLPRFRERNAERGSGRAKRTVWVFSDFDPIIFTQNMSDGFRRIPWRPFQLIIDRLGAGKQAENALHAARILLTEAVYRTPENVTPRSGLFEVGITTARMSRDAFARNVKQRDEAFKALSDAMLAAGLRIEWNRSTIRLIERCPTSLQ